MAPPQAGARGNMVPMAVWCHHGHHSWPFVPSEGCGTGEAARLPANTRPPRTAPCYSFMAEQAGSQ